MYYTHSKYISPVEAVMVHLGTPPKSLHGSLRIKFKSPTAYQATVNNLKRVDTQVSKLLSFII